MVSDLRIWSINISITINWIPLKVISRASGIHLTSGRRRDSVMPFTQISGCADKNYIAETIRYVVVGYKMLQVPNSTFCHIQLFWSNLWYPKLPRHQPPQQKPTSSIQTGEIWWTWWGLKLNCFGQRVLWLSYCHWLPLEILWLP